MPRIRKLLGKARIRHDGMRITWAKPGWIRVDFLAARRKQWVRYREEGDDYELVSAVATAGLVREHGLMTVVHEILRRNRVTTLVGFRLRDSDALEAWVRQRATTMHRDDLLFCIAMLAQEADRFEEVLTGRDT